MTTHTTTPHPHQSIHEYRAIMAPLSSSLFLARLSLFLGPFLPFFLPSLFLPPYQPNPFLHYLSHTPLPPLLILVAAIY